MDIDVLTRELQVRSRARSARAHLSAVASRPPSSLASSVDVVSHPTPNRPTAASLPIPVPAIHHDDAHPHSDADSVANSSEAESRISEAEEIYAPSVLRRNLRTILSYLARLCQIRIRSRGAGL